MPWHSSPCPLQIPRWPSQSQKQNVTPSWALSEVILHRGRCLQSWCWVLCVTVPEQRWSATWRGLCLPPGSPAKAWWPQPDHQAETKGTKEMRPGEKQSATTSTPSRAVPALCAGPQLPGSDTAICWLLLQQFTVHHPNSEPRLILMLYKWNSGDISCHWAKDIWEARNLLGFTNRCSCSAPDLATITQARHESVNKVQPWEQADRHKYARMLLKAMITCDTPSLF